MRVQNCVPVKRVLWGVEKLHKRFFRFFRIEFIRSRTAFVVDFSFVKNVDPLRPSGENFRSCVVHTVYKGGDGQTELFGTEPSSGQPAPAPGAAEGVAHHHAQFCRASKQEPGWTGQFRALVGRVDRHFHDLDRPGFEECLSPDDYGPSQALARRLRGSGSDGVHYPSVRDPGGFCIAAFWPDICRARVTLAVSPKVLIYVKIPSLSLISVSCISLFSAGGVIIRLPGS